jgi:plastocyanin
VVSNNAYTPSAKSVGPGTTVNWTWDTCTGTVGYDEACVAHTVTFDDGVSSAQQEKGTFSRTFTAAGTYAYHCLVHGTKMSGTITVQ